MVYKLGSQCLVAYRDSNNNILIIYLSKVQKQADDSKEHVMKIVRTTLDEIVRARTEQLPTKLKLLFQDISMYISTKDFLERLGNQG